MRRIVPTALLIACATVLLDGCSRPAPAPPAPAPSAATLSPRPVDVVTPSPQPVPVKTEEEKRNWDAYEAALGKAEKAVTGKRYTEAVTHYEAALKLFRTDAAQRGLNRALAEKSKADEDARVKSRVETLLAEGQAALAKKEIDKALLAYREAKKLAPTDAEVLAGLSRAEREWSASPKGKQQKADYDLAMSAGGSAMGNRNYAGAVNAYNEALRIMPGDAAATAQRDRAQGLLKAAQDSEAKRIAEYNQQMTKGQTALNGKRYAEAVSAYTAALTAKPGDAAATAGLAAARKGLAEPKLPDPVALKKAAYDKAMNAGKAALLAKNYAGAVNAYNEALGIMPGDAAATAGLAEARKGLTAPKVPVPLTPAEKQKKADYDLAMGAGEAALKAKNYAGAVNAFNEALRIMPGDAAATAQRDRAQGLLKAAQDSEAKRIAEYNQQMTKGQTALNGKRYAEAVSAYTAALAAKPGDAAATAGLAAARKGLAEPKLPDPVALKKAAYDKAMSAGKAALLAKNYTGAVNAYNEALGIMPGDAAATAGLAEARKGLTAPKKLAPLTPAEKQKKADYDLAMGAGEAALKAKNYAGAVNAFKEALRIMPGEARATTALRNAQFQQHWTVGQAAQMGRRFADAIKSYEEALKLQPTNAEVKAALARARANQP